MDPYTELGVDRKASKDQIKKAYHKKAKVNHPDKGGSTEKIQTINRAYALLKDDTARAFYDQYGEEKKPDSTLAQAVNIAYQIIMTAIEKDIADMDEFISSTHHQWAQEFNSKKQGLIRQKEKIIKFKLRILNKPRVDFIGGFIDEQARNIDNALRSLEDEWAGRERAFVILSDYSFEDIVQQAQTVTFYINTSTHL